MFDCDLIGFVEDLLILLSQVHGNDDGNYHELLIMMQ